MPSLNQVFLIGHVGRDAEVRYTKDGKAVANFTIATREKWSTGERTDWHNIVAWEKGAEFAQQYAKKGAALMIEGQLQSRGWMDRDGKKRTAIEVRARRLHPLARREETPVAQAPAQPKQEDDDPTIPF